LRSGYPQLFSYSYNDIQEWIEASKVKPFENDLEITLSVPGVGGQKLLVAKL
jgi:hypothetical protein